MNDPTVENLTLGLILYLLLPLWVIVGSLDYLCHRASHIERNDGLRESLMHMGMGVLVGIPIWLGIFCKINVLVMLVCFICFILHEIVAHNDVVWAASRRKISIWETHLHNYLGTIPFYVLALVICRNWAAFINTITLKWSGEIYIQLRPEPLGSANYVMTYAAFMIVVAILPYVEEVHRCWKYQNSEGKAERE